MKCFANSSFIIIYNFCEYTDYSSIKCQDYYCNSVGPNTIFLVLVDLPFLQSEDTDIVRAKILELCKNQLASVFPISAKFGSGLGTLTDKIRNVIDELRLNSDLLDKETD